MKKKYNIIFASHPDYSGNAKALYEYMRKNDEYKSFSMTWVLFDEKNYVPLKNKKVDCVTIDSKEFDIKFKKANIVFFTHDELIDRKLEGQVYIYLGHGNSSKKYGYFLTEEHLVIGDNTYLKNLKKSIDYIICSSELWKLFYHTAFGVSNERILSLGTPRTDYIYSKKSFSNLEKVCKRKLDSYDKCIMYLPTFRSGLGRVADGDFSQNVLNLHSYEEKDLDDFLKKNNYLLIVKHHPYEQNVNVKFTSNNIIYIDNDYMNSNFITLTEIISSVDLVIGDYSSAHVDYLILDKPVCFLDKDISKYIKNRGILLECEEFWFPGPRVRTLKDFEREINKLMSDSTYFFKERNLYVDLTYSKNTKSISKKITKYLFESNVDLLEKSKQIRENEFDYKYENEKLLNDKLNSENKELKNELTLIKNSKGWKLLEKIRKVVRR